MFSQASGSTLTINDHSYRVQAEWSNQAGSCVGATGGTGVGTVSVTLATVQSGALTTSGFTSSFTLTPGAPTGSTPLTINVATGTASGTYTVFVKAQATQALGEVTVNLPSVTVQIAVTV